MLVSIFVYSIRVEYWKGSEPTKFARETGFAVSVSASERLGKLPLGPILLRYGCSLLWLLLETVAIQCLIWLAPGVPTTKKAKKRGKQNRRMAIKK